MLQSITPIPTQPFAAKLRKALFAYMEEAEMFREMDADDRRLAQAWLDHLPDAAVAGLGRAFAKESRKAAFG